MYNSKFQILKVNTKIKRVSLESCENIDMEEDGPM